MESPRRGAYQLKRSDVERRGRRHSSRRALLAPLLVLALLLPVWMVCRGWLSAPAALAPAASARLALTLGVLLVPAYVQFGYRSWELVRSSRAPRVLQRAIDLGLLLIVLASMLHLGKIALVWQSVAKDADYPVSFETGGLFTFGLVLLISGLLVSMAAAAASDPAVWTPKTVAGADPGKPRWWRRWVPGRVSRWVRDRLEEGELQRWRAVVAPEPPAEDQPVEGTVICCSGGGVRSASFCLGGLQALTRSGRYASARAVVGVSGGGYVAAAMHVVRWQSTPEPTAHHPHRPPALVWPTMDPPAYASGSPELGWLRRNTNYLVSSVSVAGRALLSICYGLAVNLVFVLVMLAGIAWWLAWFYTASGAVTDWSKPTAVAAAYRDDRWALLTWSWGLMAVGPAMFVVGSLGQQFAFRARSLWFSLQRASAGTLCVGVVLWVALAGLPWLLVWLHNYVIGSGSTLASLLYAIGLAPRSVCATAGPGQCGSASAALQLTATSSGLASIGAVVAAIVAVLRVAMAKLPTEEATSAVGKLIRRVAAPVVQIVVPWTAFVVVLAAGLSVEVRWIAALVERPDQLQRWDLLYRAGLAFLAAAVLADVNWTSLHHFYRERLSSAFLVRRVGPVLEEVPYALPLRFSEAAPPAGRGPTLVTCAVANVSDREIVPAKRHATPFTFSHDTIGLTDRMLPASRRSMPSAAYEFAADPRYRDVTITAAMAMSGAAFSPLAGRFRRRIAPFRVVMALANARLGVWVANPMWADPSRCLKRLVRLRRTAEVQAVWLGLPEPERVALVALVLSVPDLVWLLSVLPPSAASAEVRQAAESRWGKAHRLDPSMLAAYQLGDFTVPGDGPWPRRCQEIVERVGAWSSRPGAFRLFKEAVGTSSVFDRKLYITDGGHYDNLGLLEALRRRPKTVVVLDASNDAENTFAALGEAVATAAMDLDCTVRIDTAAMIRPASGPTSRAERAWATGTITYADGEPATLHVVKAVLPRGLPLDVEVYAAQHPEYPRTSTSDQLYGEFDLEAYRVLGEYATDALLEHLDAAARGSAGTAANRPENGHATGGASSGQPRANGLRTSPRHSRRR
jgi:hypothetical protein